MKNVPTYYAKTLIIARIAATIIPTPIDFNNLIIMIRGFMPRIYSTIAYVRLGVLFNLTKKSKKS